MKLKLSNHTGIAGGYLFLTLPCSEPLLKQQLKDPVRIGEGLFTAPAVFISEENDRSKGSSGKTRPWYQTGEQTGGSLHQRFLFR